jgi:hypothetical protein
MLGGCQQRGMEERRTYALADGVRRCTETEAVTDSVMMDEWWTRVRREGAEQMVHGTGDRG